MSSHTVRASPRDCAVCGWLGASGTQDLRALRLWKSSRQWRAPAVELHGCCTRTSLAEALLRQHIDGVARASSAGTKSGSRARSLVLLTMLAPVSRCARFEDQLQLDDEANWEIADGSDLGTCRPQVTSVGDLPTCSVSAVQVVLETLDSARTPPLDARRDRGGSRARRWLRPWLLRRARSPPPQHAYFKQARSFVTRSDGATRWYIWQTRW